MPILNSIISWFIRKRIHQMELFIKYPHDVQQEWFKKLISKAEKTEWGQQHYYKDIKNLRQFQDQVPVNTYEDLNPWIQRLMSGEQNLLWPGDIKWFAKSSGTTSKKSKFIPVSTDALEDCHFKGGKDLLSIYCNNHPESRIFDGKGLTLGGSHKISEINNESYYGDLSAIIIQNLPFWAEFVRTPNLSIALMDEWESKIEKMASVTSRENVTNIFGVPSWTFVLLNRIFEITGASSIQEVWPNLELFAHGGVSFEPYRDLFKKLMPSGLNYYETYNASEGFFGIQDQSNSEELLLMLDYGIFYEFIPVQELNSDHPKALALHEVELGKNYAIVISTNAGLWRYVIGDTVTFTSKNPYRIKITGRTKTFINAFGEELIVDNADKALSIACKNTGSLILEYSAGPVHFNENQSGAHEWIVEFKKRPDNVENFRNELDQALKNLNSDYEAKRYKNMVLAEPIIHVAPENTFYTWMKQRGKLGGQHKVPRLHNNRQYVEELLEIIRN